MTSQRSLGESLAFAAVTAAFSAVPLGRASRRARLATSGAAALVAAPAAAVIVSRTVASPPAPPPAPAPRRVLGPAVAGGVAGAAAAGVMAAAFVVDRLMEDALVRRGVRRPRVVIAVASGAISFVADRLDERFDQG